MVQDSQYKKMFKKMALRIDELESRNTNSRAKTYKKSFMKNLEPTMGEDDN